jgi:3-hydroxy-3-methylglutaryl CoA synthase
LRIAAKGKGNQTVKGEKLMIGITAYGAYIPLWRMRRDLIAPGRTGEKAVAGFDEDSITMAVAAADNCLAGIDRQAIGGLFFASTTSPYKEKLVSSIIAAALDLPKDIRTADFANSLRAGTIAMKAAMDAVCAESAKQIMVVVADCRLGAPGSDFEYNCGDGAAAFVIGSKEVAASVEGFHSTSSEIMDIWRADGDQFIRSGEERFVQSQGYQKVVPPTVNRLMKAKNLTSKDFAKVIMNGSTSRRQRDICRTLGFDPKTQVQDGMFDNVGNTGTALTPMLLASALEQAQPDQLFLVASYGDGCDAFVLKTTERVGRAENKISVKDQLAAKRMVPDYKTYLEWRGLLTMQRLSRPLIAPISVSALWRDQHFILPFHGAKCQVCGTIQYPPQRVCTRCHTKDKFDAVRLAGKRGTVFTYSMDYLSSGLEAPPVVITVFDFQGGGRALLMMTDRDLGEVKVGMPVEMTFRRYFTHEGIHNYIWKTMPIRRELLPGGKV